MRQFWTMHLVLIFITNSEPTPTSLLTWTEPPIYSMNFLQIDSPRPVPYLFLCEFSSSLLKSMKSFLTPSSLMPTPVSITLIWMLTNRSWPSKITSSWFWWCSIQFYFIFSNSSFPMLLSNRSMFSSELRSGKTFDLFLSQSCWFKIFTKTVIFPSLFVNFKLFERKLRKIYL